MLLCCLFFRYPLNENVLVKNYFCSKSTKFKVVTPQHIYESLIKLNKKPSHSTVGNFYAILQIFLTSFKGFDWLKVDLYSAILIYICKLIRIHGGCLKDLCLIYQSFISWSSKIDSIGGVKYVPKKVEKSSD